ncbi:MAG: type II secretion system protein [Verrucomicrobiaceae bacterium]|nr:MAG: type II secretion system protein [Verrucomicrobiaceae bacterium]
MSIIELTVVIAILLTLISILFIGSRAWKRGSDRSSCVLTLRNVQVATRSYQNMYGYNYGGRPYADNGTQDIASHLYSKGYIEQRLFQQAVGMASCPSGGHYEITTPDVFPAQGELFMTCSLSDAESHMPSAHADW